MDNFGVANTGKVKKNLHSSGCDAFVKVNSPALREMSPILAQKNIEVSNQPTKKWSC